MKQSKLSMDKKLKAKDFINLGIFSVIFIVIFFISIMCMSFVPVTQPFGLALCALIAGPVYMLMRAKVAKPCSILIFGVLYTLVVYATGSGWPMVIAVVIGTVLAELLALAGKYRSFWFNTVGYMIFMVSAAIGSYTPLLIMKDYYLEVAAGNSINGEFMMQLVNFVTGPVLIGAFALTALCAFLGALLARAMFKKHFIKAGLIKEVI